MRIPLHNNPDTPWTTRARSVVDLAITMAAINPDGFRKPRTGKRKAACKPAKTYLDRIYDLDAASS